MKAEGARLKAALLHLLTQELKKELILVEFVCAHIDNEMQMVGNHIMLCACFHNGDRHLCRAQQRTDLPETVVAQEDEVVECFIDGIHTFLACSMTTDAIRIAVDDHQTFFGDGWLHTCRLSDNCHINIG